MPLRLRQPRWQRVHLRGRTDGKQPDTGRTAPEPGHRSGARGRCRAVLLPASWASSTRRHSD